MADTLQRILANAKSGRFSSINKLSDDDVANVWENVASYIEQKMASQKGVHIPNFGTFSFSQNKLDVGNNKYVLMQRPVFNISEKFAQTHGLQYTKYSVPGHIPCPPLNYAALSIESPFDRDTVETCVREIISSVSRAVAAKRNVELSFSGIGRLQIRDSRVKMRFYKDFINQMDGSGTLLETMQNRAGTVDSVMSNRPFSRPNTSNTVVLPRIQPGSSSNPAGSNPLPPLLEIDENQNPTVCNLEDAGLFLGNPEDPATSVEPCNQQQLQNVVGEEAVKVEVFADQVVNGDVATEVALDNVLREADMHQGPLDDSDTGALTKWETQMERKTPLVVSRGGSRMAIPMAMACGVSLLDDLVPQKPPSPLKSPPLMPPRAITQADIPLGSSLRSPLKPPTPPRLASLNRSHSSEEMLQGKHQQQQHRSRIPPPDKRASIAALAAGWRGEGSSGGGGGSGSTCGHYQASHHHQQQQQQQQKPELCHICHYRNRHNIPVSFAEERRWREEEEDRILQQYQSMKDTEDMLAEHERNIQRRHDLQKIAAFNSGVSEAVNARKKAKETRPQKSYIFDRRPLTPSRFPKQQEYLRELTSQVETRKAAHSKEDTDKEFMDRLEQVELADELAKQREQFIKDKEDQINMYKKALDVQMQLKPLPIPARQPDSEMFGKNDTTNEILMERRRRAYHLLQEQQDCVDQQKRDAILKRLSQQKREELVLKRTKEDLLEDRAHNHRVRMEQRKQLEADWKTAAEAKHARDLEGRLIGLESGQLLQETCDLYRRCQQCQRRVSNCGESNLWSESYYIPGSRIMV